MASFPPLPRGHLSVRLKEMSMGLAKVKHQLPGVGQGEALPILDHLDPDCLPDLVRETNLVHLDLARNDPDLNLHW